MNDVATRQESIKADIARQAQNYDLFEFIQGMADCREGVPHEAGKTPDYDAGYNTEYAAQECIDNQSQRAYA